METDDIEKEEDSPMTEERNTRKKAKTKSSSNGIRCEL